MATAEQLKEIYDRVKGDFSNVFDATIKNSEGKVTQLQSGEGGVGSRSHADATSKFNYESFTRMEKFSRNANDCSGWAFNLKVCADAMDDEFGEAVFEVTKAKMEKEDVDALKSVMSRNDLGGDSYKLGKKIFEVLCGLTTGEANVVVRSTVEKFGGCGFGALYLLTKRYRPNTHARKIQCLSDVVRLQIVKDLKQLVTAAELLEGKVAALLRDFDHDSGDGIKTAILISIIPREYQDMVFQLGTGQVDAEYKEIRDKVVSVAGNRGQMATPVPMDIGQVGQAEWFGHDAGDWFGGDDDEELGAEGGGEVNAIGKGAGKCFRCGGFGHMARNCTTPADGKGGDQKGKGGNFGKGGDFQGKGNQGKGNYANCGNGGDYKGGYKGAGKGGKEHQGACFNCGREGHKAWECRGEKSVSGVGNDGADKDIGGIWMIANVCWAVKTNEGKLKVENKYETFDDEENDDGSDHDETLQAAMGEYGFVEVAGVKMTNAEFVKGRCKSLLDARLLGGEGQELSSRTDRLVCGSVSGDADTFMRKGKTKRRGKTKAICSVGDGRGKKKITVDSAAEESVCPKV